MPKRKYSFFMSAEDHTFVKRSVIYSRMWFTDIGRILCGIIFIGGMVSSPGLHIDAYILPSILIAIFITAFIFAYFNRPKISVDRFMPLPCSAGDFIVYDVAVKNEGRYPVRNVKISEGVLPYGIYDAPDHASYEGFVDWLEPGEIATIKLVIRCKYRDIYDLAYLLVGSSFPSEILRFPVKIPKKDKLIVYPKFITQTDFYVPFKRVYQPGGIAISSNVGDSNEFLNTRDYRKGDRLKDIHWSSYARTGKLIVKEYVDEYFIRIGILLDTEQSSLWQKDAEIFETRISVAAGIADAIAKKDYIIDLFAAGDILHHFQMGRALAHLENLLELLAGIEETKNVNFELLQDHLSPYIKQLSSMIILLGDWDKRRQDLCDSIESRGTKIRVLIFRDKPLTIQPDREATVIYTKDKEGLIR
ncbi:MAG: hypothetical protein A2Y03_10550 [Omnitrophica WOR_2 bacterium GWF2_38_59]|nr:MAG: hypothetical protein A2Y03_10550 [Omnitrophica WOR_2 bacterium GWF2_38_59]OGX59890.1 MAG: hypothetical protein A2306_00890 [Omnitrophica WOR_2 bacterium RIFOXYB2_FULL_38_16]HBM14846.1 hypothetical protein [Lentisphaeria bacterium]